jgi:cytokinesis protein
MDSIFNRKKVRPQTRQVTQDLGERSVPYDKLGPSPRSPVSVGTLSQGLSASNISAPMTNPTLTANGTEFNKFALQRARAEKANRAYAKQLNDYAPPNSPNSSLFATDSSAMYTDSMTSVVSRPSYTPSSRNLRRSEASSSSDTQSPALADFGQISPQNSSASFYLPPNPTIRPASSNTARSDSTRGSKYTPSIISSDSHSNPLHLSHFHLNIRHDDFHFPRPETDEEIEILFDNLKRTRDFPEMPNLSMDQKWHMVYSDEQIRWKERDDQVKRQTQSGQSAAIVEGAPEWYIKKFLDKTITAKQAGSLLVSLRSKEMRYDFVILSCYLNLQYRKYSWFRRFVTLQGTSVLAQTLMHLSRKGTHR